MISWVEWNYFCFAVILSLYCLFTTWSLLYCESAETISLLDKIPFIFHWDKIKVHWILNFADNTLWKLLFCCQWSCFCGWRKPENSGIKCFLLPIHTVELINLDNMYTFWLVFILFYAWYNVIQDMICA